MMRARVLVVPVFVALLALEAAGQVTPPPTVPEPRRAIVLDDPIGPIASFGSDWLMVYPATAPAPLPGTPWYTAIKVTLTPTSGTTAPRVVTIPRASVVRETQLLFRVPRVGTFGIEVRVRDVNGCAGSSAGQVRQVRVS